MRHLAGEVLRFEARVIIVPRLVLTGLSQIFWQKAREQTGLVGFIGHQVLSQPLDLATITWQQLEPNTQVWLHFKNPVLENGQGAMFNS